MKTSLATKLENIAIATFMIFMIFIIGVLLYGHAVTF